jgi:hypothetical protein
MVLAYEALQEHGAEVSLEIIPDEGHLLHSLNGMTLFDFFEQHRP